MIKEVYSRTKRTIDDWQTPKYFYKLLNERLAERIEHFHFTLDPCTDKGNWLGTEKFFTKKQDGLRQNWKGERVFVNPPFSKISKWVKKCYEEGIKENTIVVMIIPSRTDTKYWHKYIMKANEIWFCKGRVNFLKNGVKPENSSTFPLSIVLFKKFNFGYPIIKSFYHKEKED